MTSADPVQRVRDTVDILDIASAMTSLKRKGDRHEGLCPFHKEKTPSFSVDPSRGLYHCFGCGAGGDAIGLWMEYSGEDFMSAVNSLAERYGIEAPGRDDVRDLTWVLEAAQEWFSDQLRRSPEATRYLEGRRVSPNLQEQFGLGYAPAGWDNLISSLSVPEEDLIESGLARVSQSGKVYDFFRSRLMFPVHSSTGRLVGFGGRALDNDRAKYVNTPDTDGFRKSHLLYGLHRARRAIREAGRVILSEGYFDVIGLAASGLPESVASMGTSVTSEQAKILSRYSDKVIIAYDGDKAGSEAAKKTIPALLKAGMSVFWAHMPPGTDPDSLRLSEGPEAVRGVVERAEDAVWSEIESIAASSSPRNPASQAAAARLTQDLLSSVRDSLVRDGYARRAAQRLGVPEQVVLSRDGPSSYSSAPTGGFAVQTAEEGVVAALISGDYEPPDDLPGADAFTNETCRALYASFMADEDAISSAKESGLDLKDVSRIVFGSNYPKNSENWLKEALHSIELRFLRKKQRELANKIAIAEEHSDHASLYKLLAEKQGLNAQIYDKEQR